MPVADPSHVLPASLSDSFGPFPAHVAVSKLRLVALLVGLAHFLTLEIRQHVGLCQVFPLQHCLQAHLLRLSALLEHLREMNRWSTRLKSYVQPMI